MMNEREMKVMTASFALFEKIDADKIEEAADDICGWLQDAVGDMANDYSYLCMDSQWSNKIKHAKKDGVTDLKGWLADEYYNENKIFTNEDLLQIFQKNHPKLHFKPGDKYEYSNTGYMFLATIVSRVSCVSFEQFLHDTTAKVPKLELLRRDRGRRGVVRGNPLETGRVTK